MYKGRLFTFGCSFTNYYWPTWADILGREFEEFHNYGQLGGGNLFIACSVAEAVAKHTISSNDTVMIMWTNVTREDRYLDRKWLTPGNIFTTNVYPKDFIEKFVTIRGCYVRDMAQIFLTDNILQKIGCKYEFMSMVDINNSDQFLVNDASDKVQDILDIYKLSIDKFKPSVHKIIFDYNWESRATSDTGELRRDKHPLPLEHLEYLNLVLPEYKISNETIEKTKISNAEAFKIATRPRGPEGKLDLNKIRSIFKEFRKS